MKYETISSWVHVEIGRVLSVERTVMELSVTRVEVLVMLLVRAEGTQARMGSTLALCS